MIPLALIRNASPSPASLRHMPFRIEPETRNDQEELNIRPYSSLQRHVRFLGSMLARALILTLICALAGTTLNAKDKPPVQYQIPIPALPDFSALDWLQGQWTGRTLPGSPPGDVQLSVSSDLEKHFLVFRGEVSLAATPTVPASKESWMGILSPSLDGT